MIIRFEMFFIEQKPFSSTAFLYPLEGTKVLSQSLQRSESDFFHRIKIFILDQNHVRMK